jgi:ABC-type proline/glycine betaine transport system permease subunit
MTTNLQNLQDKLMPKNESHVATYGVGMLVGALIGIVAAYLYARAVDESRIDGDEIKPLQVGQLIALALAVLGLVRQIAEMGRPVVKKARR